MEKDESLAEFLRKRGAVEILVWLVDGPKRFTDLYERMEIARGTLSKRLERGADLELWKVTTDGESKRSKKYYITDRGEVLKNLVRETDSVRHLQTLYNARQDFNSDREELMNIVADELGNEK